MKEFITAIHKKNMIEAKDHFEQNLLVRVQQKILEMKQQYAAKFSLQEARKALSSKDLLTLPQHAMNPQSVRFPNHVEVTAQETAKKRKAIEEPVEIINKKSFESAWEKHKKSKYFKPDRKKANQKIVGEMAREDHPGEDVGIFQN